MKTFLKWLLRGVLISTVAVYVRRFAARPGRLMAVNRSFTEEPYRRISQWTMFSIR
jgi:hypothetical protein